MCAGGLSAACAYEANLISQPLNLGNEPPKADDLISKRRAYCPAFFVSGRISIL